MKNLKQSHTSKIHFKTYFRKSILEYFNFDMISAFHVFHHLKLGSNNYSTVNWSNILSENSSFLGEESEILMIIGDNNHQ